jgi:uncharacterized protein YbaR (Trm112 family)
MNSLIDILACPFCKLGLDELQARAMEYSIYFMLGLIYTLAGIVGFKVVRMMNREERELKQKQAEQKKPAPPPADAAKTPTPEGAEEEEEVHSGK